MTPLKFIITMFAIGALVIAVPLISLGRCASSITTNQLGDGQIYTCYLAAESTNYCYYECY